MGAVGSYFGGPGANYEFKLTNTIRNTSAVVQREMRRANQKYARKAISKAISSSNNILQYKALGFSVSTSLNTLATGVVSEIYGGLGWLSSWPSWKVR